MSEKGIGDFFISDADEAFDPVDIEVPALVPPVAQTTEPVLTPPEPSTQAEPPEVLVSPPEPAETEASSGPTPAESAQRIAKPAAEAESPTEAPTRIPDPADTVMTSREQRLVAALDALMSESFDIQAAALVSLDGFVMASALPDGMHEDKVGAMSAAILGLGERAAIELGRGALTQVFIEGDDGYVLLMAAGDRAVLTVLAGAGAKLGLVLYDMRGAALAIARLLG